MRIAVTTPHMAREFFGSPLERRLATRFERQKKRKRAGDEEERARNEDGH
jgi:hypothetical protein